MKIDEKQILIIQYNFEKYEWEDITARTQWIDAKQNAYRIKYVGNDKFYWKSYQDIQILNNTQKVNIENKVVYCDDVPMQSIKELIIFSDYAKLFFTNGRSKIVCKDSVRLVADITEKNGIKTFISYLKEVAFLINDENYFLLNQLEKLKILESSVLGKFLQDKLGRVKDKYTLVFPFSTNISQRTAVKRAMEEDLSIIQGPPGTGKTETIRNIVANYLVRGGSVAVLSGNNEAIRNVKDKFESTGFGYLNAFLGNTKNIEEFFNSSIGISSEKIECNIGNSVQRLQTINQNVETFLQYNLAIAKLEQIISEYQTEKAMNDAEYHKKHRNDSEFLFVKNYTSEKLLRLASLIETLSEEKLVRFSNRIRFFWRFGITNFKTIKENREDFVAYLKNKYYSAKIQELTKERDRKQKFIKTKDIDKLLVEQKELSMRIFKARLQKRYQTIGKMRFSMQNYRDRFDEFLERYPIIYSTTHAIRNCSGENYLYDCVIIDESSQVDLISAVLAFSVARRVVLVGDDKQLPHVIQSQVVPTLNQLFKKYNLDDCFDYVKNHILNCVIQKNKNVASTLLNEHYRCDPQIIGFCNKRFYNGELVIRTVHETGNGVTIISHGSHFERNRTNEREVDIIEKEIIDQLPANETGIMAPYNNQIALLKERFVDSGCVIDTIHKFQGKEKEYIILSTVANKIKFYKDEEYIDFLNNAHLINVAISRAKKRLYILASEDVLQQEGSILRDLSKYYEYYCSETKILKSKTYSVFDLMYDDYSPILESTKKKLLKISNFSSENIIATIIDEICKSGAYGALSYKFCYPLKYVIKVDSLEDSDDIKFVSNIHTHCDFLIYNKLNKEIELVVEVDGSQHKEEIQANRDRRKDRLLADAGVKILRLSTTTIECKEKIVEKLLQA